MCVIEQMNNSNATGPHVLYRMTMMLPLSSKPTGVALILFVNGEVRNGVKVSNPETNPGE